VQVQVVEIPIYSGKTAKKGGAKKRNAVNRSKSQIRTNIFQSHLQFVRGEKEEIFMDDEVRSIEEHSMRSKVAENSESKYKRKGKNIE